jgi:SOS-response transcriptional repressor LexA
MKNIHRKKRLGNIKELIFDNERVSTQEDLKSLCAYSDIAAGNPILLNSNIEEEFYVPNEWITGGSNCYMVKVKGHSMINANINNGDLVVIRQQNTANNYEIVAKGLLRPPLTPQRSSKLQTTQVGHFLWRVHRMMECINI